MSRKLIVLDIVLLAVMAFAAVQFRARWKDAHERAEGAKHPHVNVPVVPPMPPIQQEAPVTPMKYNEVAQKDLFHITRNPNIPVDPPAPPPPPPPPPPMPVFHGTMVLGSGPIAILSINKSSPHQGTRPGEMIGQYRLVDIGAGTIRLEWQGQTFEKNVDELSDRADANAAANASVGGPTGEGRDLRDNAAIAADNFRKQHEPAPPQGPPQGAQLQGPGEQTAYGIRVCNMNDGHPEGAIVEGYRKVIYTSPFGRSCGWERAR